MSFVVVTVLDKNYFLVFLLQNIYYHIFYYRCYVFLIIEYTTYISKELGSDTFHTTRFRTTIVEMTCRPKISHANTETIRLKNSK